MEALLGGRTLSEWVSMHREDADKKLFLKEEFFVLFFSHVLITS